MKPVNAATAGTKVFHFQARIMSSSNRTLDDMAAECRVADVEQRQARLAVRAAKDSLYACERALHAAVTRVENLQREIIAASHGLTQEQLAQQREEDWNL